MNTINALYSIAKTSTSDKVFFDVLHDYTEHLTKIPPFNSQLFQKLTDIKTGDSEKVERLGKSLRDEALKMHDILKKHLKEQGVNAPSAQKEIDTFTHLANGTGYMSGDSVENLAHQNTLALIRLLEHPDDKVKKWVKQYALYDSNGILVGWKWSAYLDDYKSAIEQFRRIESTRPWFWWERFSWYYDLFHNYEERIKEITEGPPILSFYGISHMMEEIRAIQQGKRFEGYRVFEPAEMRSYLDRFHVFLSNWYDETNSSTEKSILTNKITYDKDKGILYYRELSISFGKDSNRGYLLRMLFDHKLKPGNPLSADEYYDELDDPQDSTDPIKMQTVLHSACDGVANRVSRVFGINDMINYGKKDVTLNKKYIS